MILLILISSDHLVKTKLLTYKQTPHFYRSAPFNMGFKDKTGEVKTTTRVESFE